ncbi:hypothetical protein LCGC14_2088610, partial [marine sediment metagenome]
VKRVVELYTSKKQLIDEVEQKYKIDPSISKSEQDKIKKYNRRLFIFYRY